MSEDRQPNKRQDQPSAGKPAEPSVENFVFPYQVALTTSLQAPIRTSTTDAVRDGHLLAGLSSLSSAAYRCQ
jgi:hypothetical protein